MLASLALNALVAIAIAAAAGPLVHQLFSAKYAGAVTVLRIMLIGEVVRAGSQLLSEVLRGSGRHGLPSVVQAIDWVAFIALVTAGSAVGGLHGAAVGVVLTNFLTAAVLFGLAARTGALRSIFGSSA
jgi:O-antigen/teichoic acid export membrane protein